MTDQPIIYWQDDDHQPTISLLPNHAYGRCCTLRHRHYANDVIIGNSHIDLTAEQARSLGYALIARAIVTEPTEDLTDPYDEDQPIDTTRY